MAAGTAGAPPPRAAWLSFRRLFFAGLLLRLTLLIVGEYQDRHFPVKYTDIDYVVFTDAARHVIAGESPYARATYRYTPLLAWLMTPNVVWFRSFGKIVLVAADMVVGAALDSGLEDRRVPRRTRLLFCAATWMLNPVVANISTRGSAEVSEPVESAARARTASVKVFARTPSLTSTCFRVGPHGRLTLAALLFGFAVHFKIYPIVYAAPILTYLETRRKPQTGGSRGVIGKAVQFVGPARIRFAMISGGTFMFLAAVMYLIYGHEFLQETYLYHVSRRDHRHNFSPWFYDLYLSSSPAAESTLAVAEFAARHLGLLAFVPQIGTVALLGFAYGKEDLYFAAFAQTFAFVTWNKVCTSQVRQQA
ncbi:MAG: PIG-M-domain-containing protein [Olpidium bornovanus]|uniref:GPI mannosyltransferase 1 n=1 Tax=Olpidium bornovanus TaxID=278681 RepID=A0A8H8DG52_9FUNG|nr:MAG: PIG-M-domain-containing protein [Olpidium bornovanus]